MQEEKREKTIDLSFINGIFMIVILILSTIILISLFFAILGMQDNLKIFYDLGQKSQKDFLIWDCPWSSAFYNCDDNLKHENITGLYCNGTQLCERKWEEK